MKAPIRYLPTDKFHIIPLYGVSPSDIKKSAKDCIRDREKIGHTSILNIISKKMGFKGGFSGFLEEYESKLLPFMVGNNLTTHADLCEIESHYAPCLMLSPEDILGRLFGSDLSVPEKIFTGYNFDYQDEFWFNQGEFLKSSVPELLRQIVFRSRGVKYEIVVSECIEEYGLNNNIPEIDMTVSELLVGSNLEFCVSDSFNLMGSFLTFPANLHEFNVPEVYWQNSYDKHHKSIEVHCMRVICKLFRERINKSNKGWVEVIPYNDYLVFLKGENGLFDFFVNGSKTHVFDHKTYGEYIKRSSLPRQMRNKYLYERWNYFENHRWFRKDVHNCKEAYYQSGGLVSDIPYEDDLVKDYYKKENFFTENITAESVKTLPKWVGDKFNLLNINGRDIFVSDLVTIRDFAEFMGESEEYFNNRENISEKTDDLSLVNDVADDCLDFPVTASWYDACAYASYIEEKFNIPVRLLNSDEYIDIRKQMAPSLDVLRKNVRDNRDGGLKIVDASNGAELESSTGMRRGDLKKGMKFPEKTKLLFSSSPKYISHQSGLRFIDLESFAEWLGNHHGQYAACVRSKSVRTIYWGSNLDRDFFPSYSTGKYKDLKTGFRLCFLAG